MDLQYGQRGIAQNGMQICGTINDSKPFRNHPITIALGNKRPLSMQATLRSSG
jgi:hypothetical protein